MPIPPEPPLFGVYKQEDIDKDEVPPTYHKSAAVLLGVGGAFKTGEDVEDAQLVIGFCFGQAPAPARKARRGIGTRLYKSLTLSEYIEIEDADVQYFIYLNQLDKDSYPLGGTMVWVSAGARIIAGSRRAREVEFLAGEIFNRSGRDGGGGRGEDWTSLGRGEDWTSLGRGEDWTSLGRGEDWTSLGRQ